MLPGCHRLSQCFVVMFYLCRSIASNSTTHSHETSGFCYKQWPKKKTIIQSKLGCCEKKTKGEHAKTLNQLYSLLNVIPGQLHGKIWYIWRELLGWYRYVLTVSYNLMTNMIVMMADIINQVMQVLFYSLTTVKRGHPVLSVTSVLLSSFLTFPDNLNEEVKGQFPAKLPPHF